ncbi:MAG: ATP-binding protein [Thermodesulfovibrionales bacterium]
MTISTEHPGKNSPSQEHPQLYAEQVRLLYSNALIGLIATLINSGVLVFILRNVVPHRVMITWLVCILLVSIARFVQFRMFLRVSPDSSDIGRWGKWFIAGLALSGILWGSAGVFLFPAESIIHQAFLAFVLGGMAIGAAGAFSVSMPAFMAYALPSLAPLIVRFLALGDEMHLAMGGMSLLFSVLITGIALRINKVTVASLRLRFENSSLISYLSSAKDDLEKLNQELSSEIAERRKAEEELKRHREHLEELVDNRTEELKETNTKLQQEISERRKLQDLLSLGKKEWEETFDVISDAIMIIDKDFNVIRVNKAAQQMLGLSFREILGQKCHQLYHGADASIEGCVSCLALKTGKPTTIETFEPHLEKYLEIKAIPQVDENNEVIKLVHVIRDITVRKKMEAEVLKTQKLESIGILAGGIAHDFNNLLQAILGNISLAKTLTNPKENTFHLLEDAEKASEQARELSHRLLTFGKGGGPVRRVSYVKDLLKESISLCLSGSNIVCEVILPEDLDLVEVDKGQMTQVFNNLIINAKEAMPYGGTVEISASNVRITGDDNLPLKEGKYVKIAVADHGAGISEHHLPRIFDPYFSTKDRGSDKGMGLGLAICHSIIAKHGGHIGVESEVGLGTSFHVYLPASPKSVEEEKTEKEEGLLAGKGRVLLMDDDERVRKITGAILQQLGYNVEFARNGEEAIERYRREKESGKRFDAVILDLTVQGGIGGEVALRKLHKIDPEVKAVISSGYADDPVIKNFRAYGFLDAIAKPYTIEKLMELLKKL